MWVLQRPQGCACRLLKSPQQKMSSLYLRFPFGKRLLTHGYPEIVLNRRYLQHSFHSVLSSCKHTCPFLSCSVLSCLSCSTYKQIQRSLIYNLCLSQSQQWCCVCDLWNDQTINFQRQTKKKTIIGGKSFPLVLLSSFRGLKNFKDFLWCDIWIESLPLCILNSLFFWDVFLIFLRRKTIILFVNFSIYKLKINFCWIFI